MLNINKLHYIAEGLNIEGGYPYYDVKKANANALWANLVLVLDRPLIDKCNFDTLVANNPYPLLENAIESINEHLLFQTYITIIAYYLYNGHALFNKKRDEMLYVTVHVHQDVTCQPLIDILKSFVDRMISKLDILNVKVDYRTDKKWYIATHHDYAGTDILISLSQCAGLAPSYESGTLLIPNCFLYYDIQNKKVYPISKYVADNDLIFRLKDILYSDIGDYARQFIKNDYKSFNPNKNSKYSTRKLNKNDFHIARILQVKELWNPTSDDEMINII